MSELTVLLDRLDAAVLAAIASGRIGIARSIRLHIGGSDASLPSNARLLTLGDSIFQCARAREAVSGGAMLCVWEHGQVATVSSAPAVRQIVALTVLGSEGALHFLEQSP